MTTITSYATLSSMDLHTELETYTFAGWHSYTIIHAMIDSGQVTLLECQADPCRRQSKTFAKSGRRGQGDLLVLDHIHEQQLGGSHRLDNLRIVHLSCNSGWRRGRPGAQHSTETRQVLSDKMKELHATTDTWSHIYTEEREEKIRATKRKRYGEKMPVSAETRAKISASRKAYLAKKRAEAAEDKDMT